MPRLSTPKKSTVAVFVRSVSEGKETFRREQYNIVSLDFGDGSPVNTYLELNCGRAVSSLDRTEVYDEIRILDRAPFPGIGIGYGAPGA